MTEQSFPITPPSELVMKWWDDGPIGDHIGLARYMADQASRWGADQELEACAKEVSYWSSRSLAERLRTARRPKPQSLKEQALAWCNDYIDPDGIIRRALEALPDD